MRVAAVLHRDFLSSNLLAIPKNKEIIILYKIKYDPIFDNHINLDWTMHRFETKHEFSSTIDSSYFVVCNHYWFKSTARVVSFFHTYFHIINRIKTIKNRTTHKQLKLKTVDEN